jgi:hypothetical protein
MILEVCPIDLWERREMAWIRTAREMGGILLNRAPGGNEPFCSAAQRAINGRNNTAIMLAKRQATPEAAYAFRVKRLLGQARQRGELTEPMRVKMRYCAERLPHLFGDWASL